MGKYIRYAVRGTGHRTQRECTSRKEAVRIARAEIQNAPALEGLVHVVDLAMDRRIWPAERA